MSTYPLNLKRTHLLVTLGLVFRMFSSTSSHGREIRHPLAIAETNQLREAIKKTLENTHILLYYDGQRPGSMHILSESVQVNIEERGSLKVRSTK